jgi:excisionase family DNA binding protein
MKPGKQLSVRESALRLGVTLKFIYDLLYAGKLRGAQKVGRSWRIPRRHSAGCSPTSSSSTSPRTANGGSRRRPRRRIPRSPS